jgi:hypothetical protein
VTDALLSDILRDDQVSLSTDLVMIFETLHFATLVYCISCTCGDRLRVEKTSSVFTRKKQTFHIFAIPEYLSHFHEKTIVG